MNPTRADLIGPLDMFKIGIGPSSSHTVGPMIAALDFRKTVIEPHIKKLGGAAGHLLHVTVELFGSLAATGQGHATDGAVCAGLIGLHPKTAEPDAIWSAMPNLETTGSIDLGKVKIRFTPSIDILWQGFLMDGHGLPHPNTMRFRLYDSDKLISEQLILSLVAALSKTLMIRANGDRLKMKSRLPKFRIHIIRLRNSSINA